MQNVSLRKKFIGSLFGLLGGLVMFGFGVINAPIIPLYLAACLVLGLTAGIASFFLEQAKETDARGQTIKLSFEVVSAFLIFSIVCFCTLAIRDHIFSWQQRQQFDADLDYQRWGLFIVVGFLSYLACEFFALRHASVTEDEEAASTRE